MDLKSRLEQIQMRHETFKHLRGRHNQLDHAWNRGMGRGDTSGGGKRSGASLGPDRYGPVPTQDFYRKRKVELVDQQRRGEITNSQMRRELNQLQGKVTPEKRTSARNKKPVAQVGQTFTLANTATPKKATIAGQELFDAVNDPTTKPSRSLLSRFLMEYGYSIQMQESRKLDEKNGVKSEIEKRTIKDLPFWAKGQNFFGAMPKTSGILTSAEVAKKPSSWRSAYVYALMQMRQSAKIDVGEVFQKAQDFADHVSYLTGDSSPYVDATNLTGLAMLADVTQRLSERAGANQFDVNAGTMHTLRRILSFPLRFIQKYGFKLDAVQVSQDIENAFNTETMTYGFGGEQVPLDLTLDERGSAILQGMTKRDTESIFGYVANQFPELQTYLFTTLMDGMRGGTDAPISDQLVANVMDAVRNGTTPNEEMFSTPTMVDKSGATVPYKAEVATEPAAFDPDSGEWVINSDGIPQPASSVQLQQAIDPSGVNALMALQGGRISINGAVAQQKQQLILDLAEQTGIPPIVISSVLSYWQQGAQTIGGHTVPTLAYLQKAAASLFDLTLGFDGPLDPYQEQQIQIAYDVLFGGRAQPNLKKEDGPVSENQQGVQAMEERMNAEVTQYYRDVFDPYADIDRTFEQQMMYPFINKTQSSGELNKYEQMSENERRANYSEQEREKLDKQLKDRAEKNARTRLAPTAVAPGSPYETAEQARRALLKAIYQRTQEQLRAAGVTRSTLYRSISLTKKQLEDLQDQYRERTGDASFTVFRPDGTFDPEKVVGAMFDVPRNAMESWSTNHETAAALGANIDESIRYTKNSENNTWTSRSEPIVAEIVVGGDFDVSRIISTPATGFGQFREGEVVITGNKEDRLRVVSAHRRGGILEPIRVRATSSVADIQGRYQTRLGLKESAYWNNFPGVQAIVNQFRLGVIQGKAIARIYQEMLRKLGRY